MSSQATGSLLKHSPLDAEHRALGARMAAFGGWEMPISYTGVIQEHAACREAAAVFDVSHLGSVRCRGGGSFDVLQYCFTNDLRRIAPGRAQYTHLLDASDGHVVDDIIVWWLAPDDFVVMPNASNVEPIVAALRERAPSAVSVEDVTRDRAVLAVQGPAARPLVASLDPDAAAVGRFAVAEVPWGTTRCRVAGTGYTGEDGVEVEVPLDAAPDLWRAVVAAGAVPAGLGARDTLRLEAGLPLHGHELGPGITPLQAGLGWVVGWDKGDFLGREALAAERERGPARRLRGLVTEGRRPPREGCPVRRVGDPAEIGRVTSGNFSPTLGHGIAFAFLPPEVEVGASLRIDVRGDDLAARVVDVPFVGRDSAGPRAPRS